MGQGASDSISPSSQEAFKTEQQIGMGTGVEESVRKVKRGDRISFLFFFFYFC